MSNKEAEEAFIKRKEEQQAFARKRMDEISAKVNLGVAQLMASIKQLPLERRVAYATEILEAREVEDFDVNGRYTGDDETMKSVQAGIDKSGQKLIEDLPKEGELLPPEETVN